jgi:hypothetical protein
MAAMLAILLILSTTFMLSGACTVPPGCNEITDAVVKQQEDNRPELECCCLDNAFGSIFVSTHGSQIAGTCFCPNFDSGWCKIYAATYFLQYTPVARDDGTMNIPTGGGGYLGQPVCVDWSGVACKCFIDQANQTTCGWSDANYPEVCNRVVKDHACGECQIG